MVVYLVRCSFPLQYKRERASGVVTDTCIFFLFFCWYLGVEMTILGNNRQGVKDIKLSVYIYDEVTLFIIPVHVKSHRS